MAIELAYLTVVVKRESLDLLGKDGIGRDWVVEGLLQWEPDFYREDEHLLATSFMCPRDVRRCGLAMKKRAHLGLGEDWAVVDWATGPTEPTPWLETDGATAWLAGKPPGRVSRLPSYIPGAGQRESPRVMKLFGRDESPRWGGTDLWLVESPAGFLSREADSGLFKIPTLYAKVHGRRIQTKWFNDGRVR